MKKFISFLLALAICFPLSLTAYCEPVEINKTVEIAPLMQNYFVKEVTDKNWVLVGTDTNILHENVTIKISGLLNVTSVDVRIIPTHGGSSSTFTKLKNGDTTPVVEISPMNNYSVEVRVNEGTVSLTNKGTITVFWFDGN